MDEKIVISKKEFQKFKELENKIVLLEKINKDNLILIQYLKDLLKLNKISTFAPTSEKTEIPEIPDIPIFNEMEKTLETSKKEDLSEYSLEEVKENYKIKKKKELLREEKIYDLDDKTCPDCGSEIKKLKAEKRSELVIIPAKIFIREHKTNLYTCSNCNKTSDKIKEIRPKTKEALIERSLASPDSVAHIINEKFVKGVPLYRQSKNLEYEGIFLNRQTMSNWLITSTLNFLMPFYNLLKEKLLEREVIHADETVVQVLREKNKKATSKSYMWLYRTSGDTDKHVVLYEYQPSRSQKHPKDFLDNYKGFLHSDGYEAYHSLKEDIIVVGCWVHARRKFSDALKVIPKERRKNTNTEKGFLMINELFQLEREYKEKGLNFGERLKERTSKSREIIEVLFSWAESLEVKKMSDSLLKKAVVYLLNQEKYLRNVLKDCRLELSNNRAERSIRPFVIGRKNWLFCVSKDGALTSSVIYSLVETAKENNLSPYKYIKFLLEQIPDTKTSDLENFLPWRELVRNNCQTVSS